MMAYLEQNSRASVKCVALESRCMWMSTFEVGKKCIWRCRLELHLEFTCRKCFKSYTHIFAPVAAMKMMQNMHA